MPKIVTISTKNQQGFECYRCGHQWVPFHSSIEEPPGFCPNSHCKSPYWGEHYQECQEGGSQEDASKCICTSIRVRKQAQRRRPQSVEHLGGGS